MGFRYLARTALAAAIVALPGSAQIVSSAAQPVDAAQAQVQPLQAPTQEGGMVKAAPGCRVPQTAPTLVQAAQSGSSEDRADSIDTGLRSFRVQVRCLFDKSAYSELDALAAEARIQKLRFKGGAWQLHVFYAIVGTPGPGSTSWTEAEWQSVIAKLEQWIKDNPASPTPRVALAHAYLGFAWKARGNGYANTVTPEGWELFHQRVQSARTALEDAAKATSRDAGWYFEMQTVAGAQGWDRAQMDMLADQALANEPGYFHFATAEAYYLLPKWHGKPGDSEEYAEQVANRAGGAEGDSIYFRIAATLNCCRKTEAPALSWPRVRQGFAALEQLYGSTNHDRNAMACLALRAGDTKTAQQMFVRIGNDWDVSVWRSKALFDASRTGQAIGSTEPLRADGDASSAATPDK